MRVEAVHLRSYALPLVREWADASAAMGVRRGILVKAVTSGGIAGWGDCAPLPSASQAQRAPVSKSLGAAAQRPAGISALLSMNWPARLTPKSDGPLKQRCSTAAAVLKWEAVADAGTSPEQNLSNTTLQIVKRGCRSSLFCA